MSNGTPSGGTIASSTSGSETNATTAASAEWEEQQWRSLVSQPGTIARNAVLAAMLEKLAATDSLRAMGLAQAERNLKLRDSLVQAVLRGWGRVVPESAANWALALPEGSARSAAMATVFASAAAAQPREAVRVANLICQQNPGDAVGFGSSLIDALCDGANFETATQVAAKADGAVQRSILMAEAYSKWAALQPEQAAHAAAAITDANTRNEALHGVVGGWAEADPAGLTQFLAELPSGGDRASMLGQALQSWARLDPEAASNWIDNSKMGPDLDEGAASVATMSLLHPDVATSWAESITNEKLRSETLAIVLRNWLTVDLPAARRYFETTTDLQPAERQQIAEIIATYNTQTASGQ